MKRASCGSDLGLLLTWVATLAFATDAVAASVEDYVPLEIGNTWSYQTQKHTKMSRLFEVRETDKRGTVTQRVLRVSGLSSEGRKVFAVRNAVEERGSSIAPVVNVETVLHLSSSPKGVFLHSVDVPGAESATLPKPVAILRDPPSTESTTSYVGTLEITSSVKSQSIEAVEVPAGKFSKALKRVTVGLVSGEFSGMPVRSGTLTEVSWFVPKVGLVRQERTLDFKVHDERGVEVRLEENAERVLTKFSKNPTDTARP